MANGHGGRRANQTGRPKGYPGASKKTQLAIRRWASRLNPALDPYLAAEDVLRDDLIYWHRKAQDEARTLFALFEEKQATPEEMLALVHRYQGARNQARTTAAILLPYEKPRLSQVTIKTLDLTKADDDELAQALISMGVDLDALHAEIVDAEEVVEVPTDDAEAA